ncbi:MAG: hypothetical protein MSA04_10620 [Clostridiales bacterium]|nr:hypothetical protein [Clostridiales bacterium]
MERIAALLLCAIMLLSLCACGKSEAVSAAENAIKDIGEVTAASGDAIARAQKLYSILTESEKEKVSNRLALIEAQDEFKELQGDVTYTSAKEAYEKLNEAAELCISGMKSIYGAWSYAKSNTNQFGSFRVDGISLGKAAPAANSHIHDGIKALGIESGDWVSWTYAGYIAQAALEAKGVYNTVSTDMEEAGDIIRTLSQNEDSSYYPKLNEYYSAVYSYVDFFKEPSGNDLEQISDVMSNHEKEISSADAGFLFYK